MKLTKRMYELINSGLTLNEEETALVEEFISKKSKKVSKRQLKDTIYKTAISRFTDRQYRV